MRFMSTAPTEIALSASAGDLLVRAEKLAAELAAVVPAEAVTSTAAVGGGGARHPLVSPAGAPTAP